MIRTKEKASKSVVKTRKAILSNIFFNLKEKKAFLEVQILTPIQTLERIYFSQFLKVKLLDLGKKFQAKSEVVSMDIKCSSVLHRHFYPDVEQSGKHLHCFH